MLKNLVKKFKSHSLNEEGPDPQQTDNPFLAGHNICQDMTDAELQRRHGHHLRNSVRVGNEFPTTFNPVTSCHHGQQFRRLCCHHKQATCPHHQRYHYQGSKIGAHDTNDSDWNGKDSGTESDEELEYIETSKLMF